MNITQTMTTKLLFSLGLSIKYFFIRLYYRLFYRPEFSKINFSVGGAKYAYEPEEIISAANGIELKCYGNNIFHFKDRPIRKLRSADKVYRVYSIGSLVFVWLGIIDVNTFWLTVTLFSGLYYFCYEA